MPISPTRQRSAASEGIVLGLVPLGRDSLNFKKIAVCRSCLWGRMAIVDTRAKFPHVKTDPRNGKDGEWAMTRADDRKHVRVFFWERGGGQLVIRPRQHDWDPAGPDDIAFAVDLIDGDVPSGGWVSLAQGFLDRFDRRELPFNPT